jgi:2-aminoethylphosphonate-pyruvate transaminase
MNSADALLLNPGPVTLTDRVKGALAERDVCHREREFAELTLDVKRRVETVYAGARAHEAVLLTGSGTAAVEAMFGSLVPRGGKVLVLANGVYGERIAAILQAHGRAHEVLKREWTAGLDLEAVEGALERDPALTHVAAVHNETTTGRLNDLAGLGRLCRERGLPLLLDAVSSFAGEELELERWNVAALSSTANKCLHGAPGIAFVLARRELLDAPSHASTLYLDLARYRKEQLQGWSPFTQATHVMRALQEALRELEDLGGWQARRERYRALSSRIRAGLQELDVELLLPEDAYSSMISSFKLPKGVTYPELHDALREEGFVIYAGQAALARTIFRIANMGDLRDSDIERLLGACDHALRG